MLNIGDEPGEDDALFLGGKKDTVQHLPDTLALLVSTRGGTF